MPSHNIPSEARVINWPLLQAPVEHVHRARPAPHAVQKRGARAGVKHVGVAAVDFGGPPQRRNMPLARVLLLLGVGGCVGLFRLLVLLYVGLLGLLGLVGLLGFISGVSRV